MILNIKFKGIDDWNRPVFKSDNEKYKSLHFGSTNTLFPYDSTEDTVINNITVSELEFFGTKFNCEPHGGMNILPDLILNIVRTP